MNGRASVLFLQGFGRRDLFTGTRPEALWGWRRNVGLLIALLDRYGIPWQERYAPDLSTVHPDAELVILRDWRYRAEDVVTWCARHSSTPVISMLFQCPRAFLDAQRLGLGRALDENDGDLTGPVARGAEDGLFATEQVVVRSQLNADLFARLGYPREKMVLMPHAPLWTLAGGDVRAAHLPFEYQRRGPGTGLQVLFIGESLWRKGLVQLYRAFRGLRASGKRLHVYNSRLWQAAGGQPPLDVPDELRRELDMMLRDPAVTVHAPYHDIGGLIAAHRAADLLACPALLDCGPNVLVEAYQLGTPMLASDLCGAASELPSAAQQVVRAPRWWETAEPASAFESRIGAALDAFAGGHSTREPAPAATLQAILDTILDTWQALLQRLGVLAPSPA